jgi:hypothetical protein
MRKSFFALLGISAIAAASPAVSQQAGPVLPSLHLSGCVDFSAEYEGCLSFGTPPSEENRALHDGSIHLHARVSISPNTLLREPLLATTSSAMSDHDIP